MSRKPPTRSLDGRLIAAGAIILAIVLPLLLDLVSRAGDPLGGLEVEDGTLWVLVVVSAISSLLLAAVVIRTSVRIWMRRRHVYRALFGPLWVTILAAALISLLFWMGIVYLMIKAVDRGLV